MAELISAPIIDIRRIRNQKETIRYVAKYITKAPAQFGTAKRYWSSRDYELDQSNKPLPREKQAFPWLVDRRAQYVILRAWATEGYFGVYDGREVITARLLGFRPPEWPSELSESSP